MTYRLAVNGRAAEVDLPGATPLADVLREHLNLRGTKVGCGTGRCGSCTVRLGERTVASCILPLALAEDDPVTTVEGLSEPDGPPHPVQEAMVRENGVQCGACIPGMVMTLCTFLDSQPDPTPEQVREAMTGNICRCTGYHTIVNAALAVAAGRAGA